MEIKRENSLNADEAEKFLDDYVAEIEELGYERVPPEESGSNKANVYASEELNKQVGFDIMESDSGIKAGLEFVSYENDKSSALESMIRR